MIFRFYPVTTLPIGVEYYTACSFSILANNSAIGQVIRLKATFVYPSKERATVYRFTGVAIPSVDRREARGSPRRVSRIEKLSRRGGSLHRRSAKRKHRGVDESGFFRRGRRNGGKWCRRANGRKYGTRKRSDSFQDRRRSMS